MAEAWTYEQRGDMGVVVDENGLPVAMRVGEEDGKLIAAAPRMASAIRSALHQLCQGARIFERDDCVKQLRNAYRDSIGMEQLPGDSIEDSVDKLRARNGLLLEALETVTSGLISANSGFSENNFGEEILVGIRAIEAAQGRVPT